MTDIAIRAAGFLATLAHRWYHRCTQYHGRRATGLATEHTLASMTYIP